jgi:Alpha amylase, catalytic domain
MNAWWKDAVVYEVYPRSFADADGDGVGDLPGLRSRLGCLADLGVDAVWLTPFSPSPLADGGYDVSDYCAADPLLGTLADFDGLVKDAAAHRIRDSSSPPTSARLRRRCPPTARSCSPAGSSPAAACCPTLPRGCPPDGLAVSAHSAFFQQMALLFWSCRR